MKHLGDITKIRGDEIEPVDCIVGGSPCQDLSVAGKRAGLSGARSGLFMEQIRIVKEMRKKHEKPKYMVWENVPGAFSSNGGEDFRAVLEETIRIANESAVVVPRPPRGGWTNAGCVMGDGYSVAWRLHNAKFWGVPQSRRRIALVADFGGESAPEILFEREGEETSFDLAAPEGISGRSGVWRDTYAVQGNHINRSDHRMNSAGYRLNVGYTMTLVDRNCVAYDDVLRRLTPLECERMQGFPDGWTDIEGASDTRRYEAIGNSIALPFWRWMFRRMAGRLPAAAKLGSLFDGIGGFPLLWQEIYGDGMARWASEINEFGIAVTKRHFGEG